MLNEQRNKIVIIDDDPSRRRKIRDDLATTNYWVIDTNRIKDMDSVWKKDDNKIPSAKSLISSHFFHAAVVDLSLDENDPQDRSGFDVLKLLSIFREGTKSIILTGFGETQDVRTVWKDLGAFDWLDKDDYTPKILLEKIENAVKEAKLRENATMGNKLTYGTLIGNPSLTEVQEKLNNSGGEVIRSVVEEALRPWYPYDPSHRIASFDTLYIKEAMHSILLVKLWSRYLGGCIELRLGSREACTFLVEVNKRASKKEGEDFKEFVLDPNDKLSAVVEYNPSIKLEDLKNSLSPSE